MRVIIIEDELHASENIVRFLHMYDPSIEITQQFKSVSEALEWFSKNKNNYDLIISDIQLLDGTCFDIFKKTEINKPIIFTTSYDNYALEAFKQNSINYLLKPITFEGIFTSMEKMKQLRELIPAPKEKAEYDQLNLVLSQLNKSYKTRFMVRIGEHIRSFTTDEISFFYAQGRNVMLTTKENREYVIDFRLDDLSQILNPSDFFRINRSVIVNINSIEDVVVHSNSRLLIKFKFNTEIDTVVSREKVNAFKEWFGAFN